uniref:Uncharacterized protein n=1 Tax=Anguilla anguilla TaxID=7936 RepID=A0A0E9TTE9_ANGAN
MHSTFCSEADCSCPVVIMQISTLICSSVTEIICPLFSLYY